MTKTCFVISPIGEEGSEIRQKADRVYEQIIKRACKETGYHPVRADEIEKPGFIHAQIITELMDADLVVADLTGHNPNVFYELAVRHYSKKPVIHLIEKPQKIPFDVASNRAINYSFKTPEDGLIFVDSLRSYIVNINEDNKPSQNPITEVLNIRQYERSEDPKDQTNAAILSALQELRQDVREYTNGFSNGLSGIREAVDLIETRPVVVSRFSSQAVTEILNLAKILNAYSSDGAMYSDSVNLDWISSVRERLRTLISVSNAPDVVVKSALAELDKGRKVTKPQRPRLDIDEEFPAEEDLPF